MEFSFKTKVHATKEKVWGFYADVQKWYIWEQSLKSITLDGGFQEGSAGTMVFEGMPPIDYVLTCVSENKEFWDKSVLPFGTLHFGHEITEEDHGYVSIQHTVRLESDSITEDKVAFLKQVFADVPDAVLLIKKTVEA